MTTLVILYRNSVRRITPHSDPRGYLSIAQNSGDSDYLNMAYVQAMSIKLNMPTAKYAVIVDLHTLSLVSDKHKQVFDYVIELSADYAADEQWKLSNEWQVFWLTPFKETIKIEADILIPRNITHWWNTYRLRDVVLPIGCLTYANQLVSYGPYRSVMVANDLPDVYSGLMYFRYSETAAKFFSTARYIFTNWRLIAPMLTAVSATNNPTTDVVYALAAKIVSIELTTLPSIDFINFVHMKARINGWPDNTEFHKSVNVVVAPPEIRINNVQQSSPVHYHFKDFITQEIINDYERILGIG